MQNKFLIKNIKNGLREYFYASRFYFWANLRIPKIRYARARE